MSSAPDITLLDGGMGQELVRRSKTELSPLWSANVMMQEPEIVETIHREYIKAGAQLITLNSYSATPERLSRDASEDLFEPLQTKAIEIANRARRGTDVQLGGCLSPLFGSYHPESAPDYDSCLTTYRRVVSCQQHAVDVFLCETMSSIKEATAATRAANETGKPVWCALSVDDDNGTILRSGEPVMQAVFAALEAGADAILFNCSMPEAISSAIKITSEIDAVYGAYANGFTKANDLQLGGTVDVLEARSDLDPEAYADFVAQWIEDGATIIGGCCEVGPAHIAELKNRFC